MNEFAPTHVKHVKESTVTMDAGEMRCDASSAPTTRSVLRRARARSVCSPS